VPICLARPIGNASVLDSATFVASFVSNADLGMSVPAIGNAVAGAYIPQLRDFHAASFTGRKAEPSTRRDGSKISQLAQPRRRDEACGISPPQANNSAISRISPAFERICSVFGPRCPELRGIVLRV
jgi:hypothetical protein